MLPIKSSLNQKGARTLSRTILCILCFLIPLASSAQDDGEQQIRGKITDPVGQAIPGVSITVKGMSAKGTSSDSEGNFQLSANSQDVLVISAIGYITQEVKIGEQQVLHIQLATDNTTLDEVVVVGYGTQKRSNITGAIASISAEDIVSEGFSNVGQAIQGKVAGVQIESGGGNPGSGVRVLIRGTGSLNNNNPLYIVDGVQVDNINNIAPNDIASMDVLKDASAAAIYGSRAANGVVLVTTKSGKKGDHIIALNAYYGFQKLAKKLDVLNAQEWASVSNAAHDNAGLARLEVAENYAQLADVDWQDEIFHKSPMQNYNMNAAGGGENYNYSISGDYLGQEGIVRTTGYERYNLRIKSDLTKGRVKIGETIILSDEKWRNMSGGWGGQGGGPVGAALKMIPVFDIYNPDAVGGFGGAYGPVVNVANPLAQLHLDRPEYSVANALINAYAEVSIIDGLKYKYNAGYTRTYGKDFAYQHPYEVGTLFINRMANLYERRTEKQVILQEHTLTYDKQWNKHSLQGMAGYTYQNTRYRELSGRKSGMPRGIEVLDAGTTNTVTGSNALENTLISYFGRLIYTFDDKYTLTAIIRRDGSSRFGEAYKYGNFPSLAAAWNVSNESFFKDAVPAISSFKIRAGYGKLGNQEISDYQFLANINPNINYVIGADQHLMPGATQVAFATPDIRWESSETYNAGIDLGLFNNKLSVIADYFVKNSNDILLQVPIPLSTGAGAASPFINAGSIRNKGFEADLSFADEKGDFSYGINATFSTISNEVLALGTGSQQIFGGQPTHHGASATVTQAGWPVGAFYLIHADGIFQSEQEVQQHSLNGQLIQPNAKPGDIRFRDVNNDGKIDQNDRQYAGSPNPKFSYGFGGNLRWKNIDLNLFFQGTYGNKIYNGLRQDLEGMNLEFNYLKTTLNAWTPQNTNTNMPRAVINDPNLNSQTSDRFLESGSYLRLRTVQLGYTLPSATLEHLKINNCRFYVSLDNVFTISKYKGYNPDLGRTGSVLNRGVDFGHIAYPLAQTAMLGVQVSF
ncbi:TonB-dependent receptor [Olivibacter sp. LS-1]|jgi:TonB-linked SusC/RagA family outer membrane protein|uniref:SusC/RagA family TonB-linked outer membrane protein n=1 Tax=Olivibacter sp. LS-1 TaxID=2592345 RepID=UPI0011EAFF60|nr:TonB-dependent receptor [Olivibacter sp. LS-1]QEL03578.1 TonB-dependent receptor [Olivibacter sp. LS-1]